MKVRIVAIRKSDAFYPVRKALKGKTGDMKGMEKQENGWVSGIFHCDSVVDGVYNDGVPFFFAYVKVEEVK